MILFKRTSALLIVTILFAAATAHAEIKIYTGVGEYIMNDNRESLTQNCLKFAREGHEI